ncbi:MAG: hypothetical protein LBE03_02055 [Candidatus Nomurabacteria bacterium]|jgi:transposase|nr:hypothetical protein [Candidatus Nomurabacteria bacterium]
MVALSEADSKLLSRLLRQDYYSTKSQNDLGVKGLKTAKAIKKSPRTLNDTEILEAITQYNNGTLIKVICREYGCCRGYLAKLLKAHGVKIVRRSRLQKEKVQRVIRLHATGLSSRSIEAQIGIGYKSVQRIVRNAE